MLEVVQYKENINSVSAGFKKYNFVVYGEVGKVDGLSKEDYLQEIYAQCKSSIDYESQRYLDGKPNSITTDLEGEEFIPEEPKLTSIDIELQAANIYFNKGDKSQSVDLTVVCKNQFNEVMDMFPEITSSIGSVVNSTLVVPIVDTFTEIEIKATMEDVESVVRLDAYAPKLNDLDMLNDKIWQLQEENMVLMLATTQMYEEQYVENLNLMMAITELYEMNMEVD